MSCMTNMTRQAHSDSVNSVSCWLFSELLIDLRPSVCHEVLRGYPTWSWSPTLSWMHNALLAAWRPATHSACSSLSAALLVFRPARPWLPCAILTTRRRLSGASRRPPIVTRRFLSALARWPLDAHFLRHHHDHSSPSWLFSGTLLAGT